MKKDSFNYKIIQFLLLANIAITILVFFINGSMVDAYEWLILLWIIVAFSIFMYMELKQKFYMNMEKLKTKISANINEIAQNRKIDMNTVAFDEDLKEFYDNLDRLGKSVFEKDDTYKSILELLNSIVLTSDLEKMFDDILPKIIDYTKSFSGAFYLVDGGKTRLEIKSSMGFSKNIYSEFDITIGEGFIGTSVSDNKIKVIEDLPDDTIYLTRTFLGKIKPKNLLIVPISEKENIVGMLVLVSTFKYTDIIINTLNIVRSYIGVAIANALIFEQSRRSSNELKFQNRLIQDINDDLEDKYNNRTLFLDAIIDSIEGYAIISADKDLKICAWNTGAENILGYTKKEVKGMDMSFIDYDESNDLNSRLEIVNKLGKLREVGWRVKKDGTKYYADSYYFKMEDANKNIIGYTNVIRDITQLRTTEEALILERNVTQRMLDNSLSALLITDTNGIIETFNKKAATFLGDNELKNKNIRKFIKENRLVKDSLEDVVNIYFVDDIHCTLTDNEKPIVIKFIPLKDQNNNVIKVLMNFS